MARPTIGDRAMTDAERQRRHRAKQRAEHVTKPDVTKPEPRIEPEPQPHVTKPRVTKPRKPRPKVSPEEMARRVEKARRTREQTKQRIARWEAKKKRAANEKIKRDRIVAHLRAKTVERGCSPEEAAAAAAKVAELAKKPTYDPLEELRRTTEQLMRQFQRKAR